MGVAEELNRMRSFEAIKYVLNDIELHDLQCIDVMKMLWEKKAIVSYDTGTGKTLLAAAVMQLLWNEDPSRKFIMFVKSDQLTQTPGKIESATGRSVCYTNGVEKNAISVFSGKKFLDYPVLMLTHSCLKNHAIMKILFTVRNQYCGLFIDEAHEISNKSFAQCADVISGIISKFEYAWALTATPITTSVKQLSKLANLMNPKKYPNTKKLERDLEHDRFRIEEDPTFFINRSGEELGRKSVYNGRILWVTASDEQRARVSGYPLMALCKGKGAVNQANALVRLIKEYEGCRGLVYVNQHAVREWILPFMDKAGIRYGCINGETKSSDDAEVMHQFNVEKSLDVVITSCTTAIDLDCDYVVFYEFTVLLKQMIGRADRGLDGKVLDIWYVITRGSFEPLYFKETIVDRSEMVRAILGKDYNELSLVYDELESEVRNLC